MERGVSWCVRILVLVLSLHVQEATTQGGDGELTFSAGPSQYLLAGLLYIAKVINAVYPVNKHAQLVF